MSRFDSEAPFALSWSPYLQPHREETPVLAVLLVIAAATIVVIAAAAAVSRSRHFNEVERFHRASRMTSEWARNGVTKPVVSPPDDAGRRGAKQTNGASADK